MGERVTKKQRVEADKMVRRAVQLTTRKAGVKLDTGEMVKAEEFSSPVNRFIRERSGMLEDEFFERVTKKLEGLVYKLADDLDKKHDKIPPQNLPVALGIVLDKVNNLKGRPQVTTANMSMGFGPKNRTREEMLAILGNGRVIEVKAEEVKEEKEEKEEKAEK